MLRNDERIAIRGRAYRLDAVLSNGAGSYGQVWAATDPAGRAVAIKLINAEAMTQAAPALHSHWHAHLEREINFLRGLDPDQSRHVVALLDYGVVDGQPALVLERLQANLGQWLDWQRRDGAPPPDLAQILDWADQILEGLDVVHRAGFVYRDLKFSNLLVGDDGARLKLADFGSLKREDGDNTRSFIGTPATMAPEQVLPACQGAEGYEYAVDYRADYYALGLLLFALLTDQPTTAAQRRLGQLLALYGQEGAGQRGAQLGGLDDEERELLQRSIEFWTVPARPEQGGGAAVLLVELIDRLLARDPADRPADALEIRAALDAARVNPAAAPVPTPRWSAPSPAGPPNRHLRRADRSWPRFQRRWALLAGTAGLVGALAWALVGPVDEIGPDRAEPLSAVIAPPPLPKAEFSKPAAPVAEPALSSSSSPVVSGAAPALEPGAPPLPADASPMASPGGPAVTDAPVVEASESALAADAPVAEASESADAPSAPVESRSVVEPQFKPRPPATVAMPRPAVAPAATEPRPPVRAKPIVSPKPGRPASAPAVADRPAAIERPTAVERPSTAPATASRTVKPPPPAPAASEPPQRPPIAARTPPAPRDGDSSRPVGRARPVPSVASHPPTAPKPASKPAGPVARAELPGRLASRAEPTPVLPPIKLESRPEPTPVPPPIKLESRPQSAPPAPPPIELVSRSGGATLPARPTSAVARAEPRPPSHSALPPARSADPVTQLRDDAGRAAIEVGNLFSRASTTVGKEVQRGLEATNQTVGRWTGRCHPADGCQEARVERRDRWSDRRRSDTVSQRELPARHDEDDGFAKPPPRPYRDDYR